MTKRVQVEVEVIEAISKNGNAYQRANIKFANGYVVSEPLFDVAKLLVYQQIMSEDLSNK